MFCWYPAPSISCSRSPNGRPYTRRAAHGEYVMDVTPAGASQSVLPSCASSFDPEVREEVQADPAPEASTRRPSGVPVELRELPEEAPFERGGPLRLDTECKQ